MVLKLVLLPIHSFWRRKSYMVLKPGGWTTGLEEDKIAGFSNNASIRSKQSNALEAKELQGTQTAVCEAVRAILVWKGIELQGAQTTPPSEANKAMFWKRKNCRVLKLVLLPIHSFWRRKSYMVLKSGMANNCNGLQEGKITWFSNDVQYRS